MKRLLVRRFESCIESFMKTLDAIILSNKKIKDYYDKEGLIPIYKKGFLQMLKILLKMKMMKKIFKNLKIYLS